ncbi:hypothetical protein [Microbulbifer sp. ZKSA002]|uniref:hypothetical protein n=1 Tax=Microbulbifer sp. ZKSA002 TaxID=3243388 RepID=UPI00403A0050
MPNIQTAAPQQEPALNVLQLRPPVSVVSLIPCDLNERAFFTCSLSDGSHWASKPGLNPEVLEWTQLKLPDCVTVGRREDEKLPEPGVETLRTHLGIGFLDGYKWIAKDEPSGWYLCREKPTWGEESEMWVRGHSDLLAYDLVSRLPKALTSLHGKDSLTLLDTPLADLANSLKSESEPVKKTLREILKPLNLDGYLCITKEVSGVYKAHRRNPVWDSISGEWLAFDLGTCLLSAEAASLLPFALRIQSVQDSCFPLDSEWEVGAPSAQTQKKPLREILGAHLFEGQKYLARDVGGDWFMYKDKPDYRMKVGRWQGDWDFLCDGSEDAVVAKLPQSLRDRAPKDSLVSLDSEWEV